MSYKRRKVMQALADQGAAVVREGGAHTVVGRPGGPTTTVPRHTELDRHTTRAIVKQLGLDWQRFVQDVQ